MTENAYKTKEATTVATNVVILILKPTEYHQLCYFLNEQQHKAYKREVSENAKRLLTLLDDSANVAVIRD